MLGFSKTASRLYSVFVSTGNGRVPGPPLRRTASRFFSVGGSAGNGNFHGKIPKLPFPTGPYDDWANEESAASTTTSTQGEDLSEDEMQHMTDETEDEGGVPLRALYLDGEGKDTEDEDKEFMRRQQARLRGRSKRQEAYRKSLLEKEELLKKEVMKTRVGLEEQRNDLTDYHELYKGPLVDYSVSDALPNFNEFSDLSERLKALNAHQKIKALYKLKQQYNGDASDTDKEDLENFRREFQEDPEGKLPEIGTVEPLDDYFKEMKDGTAPELKIPASAENQFTFPSLSRFAKSPEFLKSLEAEHLLPEHLDKIDPITPIREWKAPKLEPEKVEEPIGGYPYRLPVGNVLPRLGSFIDVFKHSVLTNLLKAQMAVSGAALTFIDMNPGPPAMDITSSFGRTYGVDSVYEYGKNLARKSRHDHDSIIHPFSSYMHSIRMANADKRLRKIALPHELRKVPPQPSAESLQAPRLPRGFPLYPGNFALIKPHLRPHDRCIIFESNTDYYRQYCDWLDPTENRNYSVYNISPLQLDPMDQALTHLCQPRSAHGLVYIDAGMLSGFHNSLKNLACAVEMIPKLIKRYPHYTYCIAYPLYGRLDAPTDILQPLGGLGVSEILRCQYYVDSFFHDIPAENHHPLMFNESKDPTGYAHIIIRPPGGFDDQIHHLQTALDFVTENIGTVDCLDNLSQKHLNNLLFPTLIKLADDVEEEEPLEEALTNRILQSLMKPNLYYKPDVHWLTPRPHDHPYEHLAYEYFNQAERPLVSDATRYKHLRTQLRESPFPLPIDPVKYWNNNELQERSLKGEKVIQPSDGEDLNQFTDEDAQTRKLKIKEIKRKRFRSAVLELRDELQSRYLKAEEKYNAQVDPNERVESSVDWEPFDSYFPSEEVDTEAEDTSRPMFFAQAAVQSIGEGSEIQESNSPTAISAANEARQIRATQIQQNLAKLNKLMAAS